MIEFEKFKVVQLGEFAPSLWDLYHQFLNQEGGLCANKIASLCSDEAPTKEQWQMELTIKANCYGHWSKKIME